MRSFILILFSIAAAFFCWGAYGPVLHEGQYALGAPMRPSSLRPFICVGVAYFLIAVVVPIAVLVTRGEKGRWTIRGAVWSFLAGVAGAVGALGITFAFKSRGNPVYVMPLVFGLAPVVNTFVTMAMTWTFRQARPLFFLGVLMVAVGAAGVLFFRPTAKNIEVDQQASGAVVVQLTELHEGSETITRWKAESLDQLQTDENLKKAYSLYQKKQPLSWPNKIMILVSVGLTAVCWGSYGPVLHKGQGKMSGSRLRPFLCVGLAYFAIAVVAPVPLLQVFQEPGGWNQTGVLWSLAAGAAGAIGALGIILAFNFGGRPIFVMPLVFGGAPVVNTLITIVHEGTAGQVSLMFYGSLVAVIAGAVTVLVFAPKPGKPETSPAPADPPKAAPSKAAPSKAAPPEAALPETAQAPEKTDLARPADGAAGIDGSAQALLRGSLDPDSGEFGDEAGEDTIHPDETIHPDSFRNGR